MSRKNSPIPRSVSTVNVSGASLGILKQQAPTGALNIAAETAASDVSGIDFNSVFASNSE